MDFFSKIALLFALCLITSAEASIFLQHLILFLTTPKLPQFLDLMAWSLLGVLAPIIMGPLRVVTYIFWNMSISNTTKGVVIGSGTYDVTFDASNAVKAYWFLNSGVTNFN